jgi:hypothetical protein
MATALDCNSSRRTVPSGKVIVDRLRAYRSQSAIPQSENERPALAAVLPFAVKMKAKRRNLHWKAAAIIRRLRSYRSGDRAKIIIARLQSCRLEAERAVSRKVVSFPQYLKKSAVRP